MVAPNFGHYVKVGCLKAYEGGHKYASANVIMSHMADAPNPTIAKVNKWLVKESDCYEASESGKKFKLAKGTSGGVRKSLTAMGLLDAETGKAVSKTSKARTQSPKKTIAKKPKAKKPKSKKGEEAEGEEAEGEEMEAEGKEGQGDEGDAEEAGEEAGEDAAEEAGEDAAEGDDQAEDQAEEAQGEAEEPDNQADASSV